MNKMYPILAYAPRPRFWNSARVRRVAFASALVFVIMYLVFRYWHPVFFADAEKGDAEKGSEANSEKWLLTLFPCLLTNGVGQCDNWANLLLDVFAAQGVQANGVRIDPPTGFAYFVVGSAIAQGGQRPYPVFRHHWLVAVPATGLFYDPSFGRRFSTTQAYEATVVGVTNNPKNNNADILPLVQTVSGHLVYSVGRPPNT